MELTDILAWVLFAVFGIPFGFAIIWRFYRIFVEEPREDRFTKSASQFVISHLDYVHAQQLLDKMRRYEYEPKSARAISRGEALLRSIPTSRWREFEVLCGELLKQQGWTVTVTRAAGDQGVDFVGRRSSGEIAVGQAKHQIGSVSQPVIQAAVGAAVGESASLLVVATSGEFTRQARSWVMGVESKLDIELWNRTKVIELINDYDDLEFEKLVRSVVSSPTKSKINNIIELRDKLTELEMDIQNAVIKEFGRLPQCWFHSDGMTPHLEGEHHPDISWLCSQEVCLRGRNSNGDQFTISRQTRRA